MPRQVRIAAEYKRGSGAYRKLEHDDAIVSGTTRAPLAVDYRIEFEPICPIASVVPNDYFSPFIGLPGPRINVLL